MIRGNSGALLAMNIEEFDEFIEVRSKKKRNVKRVEPLNLEEIKLSENNNNKDEGISSASPTESDQGTLDLKSVPPASKKPKNKKKRKKNKKAASPCGYEASPEPEDTKKPEENYYDKFVVQITPRSEPIQHRRRRISSRGDDGDEVKSIHWAPELVLEPSRVRTSSAGSILSKSATNYWDDSSYECDCGVAGCHCYEVGTNRPKWISRSLRWKPRFTALQSMSLTELNTVEDTFHYCDTQSHLKLGSGRTVYFGLMVADGKEVVARKLKTKQLPQLQPLLIRKLLALRHPNLLRYEQFCILKNQTYLLQELIDYSLGRFLRDPSVVVQPIEKVDIARQLVTGVKYLHDKDICHTDLRPANILITQVGRVVIGNYAVAPMNTENKNKTIPKRVSEMKTSSPELWRAFENIWEINDTFSKEADIPPLGMVLFTILTNGKHPYGLTGRRESAPDAMKNMLMPKYCLNEVTDVLAKELIRHMLHKDPLQRPTIRDIQNAPYFWSPAQKSEHVKFVLRGPRVGAVEAKHMRQLIPTVGHFGDMPELLASCREANSAPEAIDILAEEFIKNPFDKEPFIQEIVQNWPILIELTKQYGIKFESEESSDHDTIGSVEDSI